MNRYILVALACGWCSLGFAKEAHSKVFLKQEERSFWWQDDFVELVKGRYDFSCVKSALDVGCGRGSWTAVVKGMLPETATIEGVDKEEKWVEEAKELVSGVSFSVADAYSLPYADSSFDFVTCQTLLLHVKEPKRVIEEMVRVLKPGGYLFLVEPNNDLNIINHNTAQLALTFEESMAILKLYTVCKQGRVLLGKGDISVGSYVNTLLPNEIEFLDCRVNDHLMQLTPPYTSIAEQKLVNFLEQVSDRYYCYTKDEARECYLMVYPDEREFERLWAVSEKLNHIYMQQITDKTLGGSFGGLLIMTVGRKK